MGVIVQVSMVSVIGVSMPVCWRRSHDEASRRVSCGA
jgi:hypothetical protein